MDQQHIWMHLNELAGRLQVEVRLERLEDGEGFEVRGGLCRLQGKMVALVDSRQDAAGRARQLGLALAGLGLEEAHMRPALRQYLESLRAKDPGREQAE